MPKVSVIIPVYNVEQYLRECMESVVKQTLHDIEIICVNDGSTDASLAILNQYAEKDPRIVLIDKENGGYGKAMNIGLEKATGEYLGIVEPDDYVSLTMFEDLYQEAKKQNLDIIKADFYRFVTDENNGTKTLNYVHLSDDETKYNKVFTPLENLDSFRFVMNTWSGIYRMSFLREFGIKHHETPGASYQDNGFWFQSFIYAKRVMLLRQPYYRLRRDNPNSSMFNRNKIYAANVEYDYIRGILMRDSDIWNKVKGVYWVKRLHNYNATLGRINPSFQDEYLEQIARELTWGYKRNEFRQEDFKENEWCDLWKMMKREKKLNDEDARVKHAYDELDLVMKSASFRVGRAITFLPRKIRDMIRGGEAE